MIKYKTSQTLTKASETLDNFTPNISSGKIFFWSPKWIEKEPFFFHKTDPSWGVFSENSWKMNGSCPFHQCTFNIKTKKPARHLLFLCLYVSSVAWADLSRGKGLVSGIKKRVKISYACFILRLKAVVLSFLTG